MTAALRRVLTQLKYVETSLDTVEATLAPILRADPANPEALAKQARIDRMRRALDAIAEGGEDQ